MPSWLLHTHPDPSHRTVVPRRGAQATNSHRVAWISCLSSVLANYYTVCRRSSLPCPCTCSLRPTSPGHPALRAVVCTMNTQHLGSWAWDCLNSASMIPRNDQASVRQCAQAHSTGHCGGGGIVSRHGQSRDMGMRAIPRRAGPASTDPRGPILPQNISPQPRLTCQTARLLRWSNKHNELPSELTVDVCMQCWQAGREADRARPDPRAVIDGAVLGARQGASPIMSGIGLMYVLVQYTCPWRRGAGDEQRTVATRDAAQ